MGWNHIGGAATVGDYPVDLVSGDHALPHQPTSEPRAALAATLQIPGSNQTFVFIGTHLDHLRSPQDRIAQATEINAILQHYEGLPVILAGDLNAVVGSVGKKGGWCWSPWGGLDPVVKTPAMPPGAKTWSVLEDPPEYPLANVWRRMRVGEVVYLYLLQGRAKLQA